MPVLLPDCQPPRLACRSLFMLAVLIVFAMQSACTRDADDPATETAPAGLTIPPAEELAGAPVPLPEGGAVACAEDDECRVWRPSAWGPRVECCYEYGCGIDFEAIHDRQWALLRAWREANPVDCTAELQSSGPCAVGSPACPFDTSPPEAHCVEGQCALELPQRWPVVADEAQTCSVNSECAAVRNDVFSARDRCCAGGCRDAWTVLNRATLRALEEWLDEGAPSCAEVREVLDCAPAEPCSGEPPAARCSDGFCVRE